MSTHTICFGTLTLILLITTTPTFANSVDRDQMASEEEAIMTNSVDPDQMASEEAI